MSASNRYYFTKELYPNYLVLIIKKNKLISFGRERRLLEYIGFNGKINYIRRRKINYLILDNLDIIEIKNYNNDNLNKYLSLMNSEEIFKEIKVIMSHSDIL